MLDLSGVNFIDSSAIHALNQLIRDAKKLCPDIQIALAGLILNPKP